MNMMKIMLVKRGREEVATISTITIINTTIIMVMMMMLIMVVKRGMEEAATISTDFLGERTPLSRQLTTPPYLRCFLIVIFGFVIINALEPSHVSIKLNRMN